MTLKYDQTIRENTMSMNGLYNSRSEFDPGACRRGGLRVAKGASTVDANAAAEETSMDARGGSRYDEVYARAARRRNMSAPDASGEADRLASAQGARSAQAAQIANIAARLKRPGDGRSSTSRTERQSCLVACKSKPEGRGVRPAPAA